MTENEQKSILQYFDEKYLTDVINSKVVLQTLQSYLFSTNCELRECLDTQRFKAALSIAHQINEISNALEAELENLSRQCSNILNYIYKE